MVYAPLVQYIEQLLKKGYSLQAIKANLLQSGYNLQMIDEACASIYGTVPNNQHQNKSHTKLFIGIIVAILGIIIISLVFLFLPEKQTQSQLSLMLQSDLSEIEPGQSLTLTTTLQGLSENALGSTTLQYLLQFEGSLVHATQETAQAQQLQNHYFSFVIPNHIASGNYVVEVVAKYGSQTLSKKIPIFILEPMQAKEEIRENSNVNNISQNPSNLSSDLSENQIDAQNPILIQENESTSLANGEDCDGDTILDDIDLDDDNDGILDSEDIYICDTDNDAISNYEDTDDDNDGVPDNQDANPLDSTIGLGLATGQQDLCTQSCNDLDICTQDSCVGGTCQHTPIVPCCGDFICQEGETQNTCAIDCITTQAQNSTALLEEAKTLALEDATGAASICEQISNAQERDDCFRQIASAATLFSLCESIIDESKRDNCYMYFALNMQQPVCPFITNEAIQRSCEGIVGV